MPIVLKSRLYARKWSPEWGWVDVGLLGTKCVTNAFVELLVDYLQGGYSGIEPIDSFRYHDCGTGTTAESIADTELEIPSGMAREEGTQEEGEGACIYRSVAVITSTISGTTDITEHGLFNAAADGILMDRTVFNAISIDFGNEIEFTYELPVLSGG
jgi:hypothetical protein